MTSPISEPIVLIYLYRAPCPVERTTMTVEDLTLTTTNSNLTDVTISGFGLTHFWTRNPTFETTATLALFGTFGTESDTLGIS
jgi:hypothetical protein